MKTIQTQCCIVGGGPAGIMLGYLLARAGMDVTILEKWDDFFRDFRGDTIHPSTMEILEELGLLEKFLKLPVNKTQQVSLYFNGKEMPLVDFSHLKKAPPFVGFIPQWDFLNFLAEEGKKYPSFNLLMGTEAIDLIKEKGQIVGVTAKNKSEKIEIRSDLVVGADGRSSIIRKKAGLKTIDLGSPIDVLWFRLPQKDDGENKSLGYTKDGKMLVMLDRDDYWQCAYIIRKDGFEDIKKAGLKKFRQSIASFAPQLQEVAAEITSFEKVKLLSVAVDYLPKWYLPNLICIGDAAHAMSPVGGVGVNLAIQDAVAAANILAPELKKGRRIKEKSLKAVQKRRKWPARLIQNMQIFIHENIIIPILAEGVSREVPWQVKLLANVPYLRRIPAWVIGIGVQPEHVSNLKR